MRCITGPGHGSCPACARRTTRPANLAGRRAWPVIHRLCTCVVEALVLPVLPDHCLWMYCRTLVLCLSALHRSLLSVQGVLSLVSGHCPCSTCCLYWL